MFFDGDRIELIPGERHRDGAAHGSGCTHSSALAAHLALGYSPLEAARAARAIAGEAVRDGLRGLGAGAGPVDVFGLAAENPRRRAGAPRAAPPRDIIARMKFLRMRPGYGEQLIAEGDVDVAGDEERLVEEFRRQLEQGMWAAVPVTSEAGRREAEMVRAFEEIPRTTDRVIFFPRAAGGALPRPASSAVATRHRRRDRSAAVGGVAPVDRPEARDPARQPRRTAPARACPATTPAASGAPSSAPASC